MGNTTARKFFRLLADLLASLLRPSFSSRLIFYYFALVGFLLVIFTYPGVSYLLPGLHSYA